MSELEPYIGPHPTDNTLTEYYLKSEVDKVLAEKDKEIAELKGDNETLKYEKRKMDKSEKCTQRCNMTRL